MDTSPDYLINITEFPRPKLRKYRFSYCKWGETLVNDPTCRFNTSAAQIVLKRQCFMDRCRFRQGHQEYLGKGRVTQARKELTDCLRNLVH